MDILAGGGEGAVEDVVHSDLSYTLYPERGAGVGSCGEYADEDSKRDERHKADYEEFHGRRPFLRASQGQNDVLREFKTYFLPTTEDQTAILLYRSPVPLSSLLQQLIGLVIRAWGVEGAVPVVRFGLRGVGGVHRTGRVALRELVAVLLQRLVGRRRHVRARRACPSGSEEDRQEEPG